MALNILIIDDETGLRKGLKKILSLQKYNVFEASCCKEAREVITNNDIDLIFLDLKLGKEDGFDYLKELKKEEPLIPVIIITGYGNIKNAVECLKIGAINYITKPIDKDLLVSIIKKEIDTSSIIKENIRLKESLEDNSRIIFIKSKHPVMKEISYIIERVKNSNATVLILGESGTGKEITAKNIHYSGKFNDKPFIGVNCAALNDNLLESELFGHEKGAFTGAISRKLGRFELARDGALFLDEVGDMSLRMQAKFLRVLQEKNFERVGGTKSIQLNCRIIAASNKDLKKMLKQGKFREDLYYRLSLIVIKLPQLRQRKCDIKELIDFFIKQANAEYGQHVKSVNPELLKELMNYEWPGNIRQLKNVITNAVILSQGEIIEKIDLFEISSHIFSHIFKAAFDYDYKEGLKKITNKMLENFEKEIISKAISDNLRNFTKTAKDLKITRKTLYEKVQKYKL